MKNSFKKIPFIFSLFIAALLIVLSAVGNVFAEDIPTPNQVILKRYNNYNAILKPELKPQSPEEPVAVELMLPQEENKPQAPIAINVPAQKAKEEEKPKAVPPTQDEMEELAKAKREPRKYTYNKEDCDVAKTDISEELSDLKTCWKDEDCLRMDLGYPWQGSACEKKILSKDSKEKVIQLLGKMEVYNEGCVINNKTELKKHKDIEKQIEKTDCPYVPLTCLKGICRTSTYAIIDTENTKVLRLGK